MDIFINKFINNLTCDLDTNIIPKKIDLVISGGAFNGIYATGITMYLKKLEELNKIKIRRISGASVGSLIGLAYLLDKINIFNEMTNDFIYLFKKKCNLYDFHEKINTILDLMDKDDYLKLNNRLYITYFDFVKKKQIVIKKYKNNEHVLDSITKSCYIPFLMDKQISYNGKIDGGYPFIFKNKVKPNKKTLYINLLSFTYIHGVFYLKDENNSYLRIIRGILDIDTFLKSKKNTHLCSYIDDWSIIDYILFHLNAYFMLIILLLLDVFNYINVMIPNTIKTTKYYILFKTITYNMYKDIFTKLMT